MKKYLLLSLVWLFTVAHMHGEEIVGEIGEVGETGVTGAADYQTDGFPLHTAVRENNVTEVKRLISSGADVNKKDYQGYTPLHWSANADFLRAASVDCLTIAQLFVDAGADVNARDYHGENTPLDGAAFWGREEMVQLLLNAGADVALKNSVGYTALDEAEMFGRNEKVIALLKDAVAANSSFMGILKKTFFERPTVQWLMEHQFIATMAFTLMAMIIGNRVLAYYRKLPYPGLHTLPIPAQVPEPVIFALQPQQEVPSYMLIQVSQAWLTAATNPTHS